MVSAEVAANANQGVQRPSRPYRFGKQWGDGYGDWVNSNRENLWPCNPRARKGSAAGSVERLSYTLKMGKLVTFLGANGTQKPQLGWIENPCVGGSIPPQATTPFKSLLFS